MSIKALLFDVFGTVVDWRTAIIREGEEFGRANAISGIDWTAFADDWRALYQPAMQQVRSGSSPWIALDDLHRMNLDKLLAQRGTAKISEPALDHFDRAWHRLDPWPDSVSGLARLKNQFIVTACSNGNVALMVNLARHARLPWDMILGAEIAQQYKPMPEVYRKSVAWLRLMPEECVMVAAHNSDLEAASACGLQCAFVARPDEFGPNGKPDLKPTGNCQFVAKNLNDLAQQMGC